MDDYNIDQRKIQQFSLIISKKLEILFIISFTKLDLTGLFGEDFTPKCRIPKVIIQIVKIWKTIAQNGSDFRTVCLKVF